jgi:LuxR family maltose regulon positive regulatory protein
MSMEESPCRPESGGLGDAASFSGLAHWAAPDDDGRRPTTFADERASARNPPPTYAFRPVMTPLFASFSTRETLPKITTLVAPPGFGKTVFLSEICKKYQNSGIDCLWISLDERDSSLSSLLRMLEAAIGIKSKESYISEPFLQSDSADRIEQVRIRLSKELRPLILFIDNIDFCREASAERLLNALVFNTPGSVKLLVSSSSTPVPFNAGRAHLELNLQTIRAADLSFDKKAICEIFADAGLSEIDPAVLDAIVEKTEGWPAAIRLLQLTVQANGSLERGIDLLPDNDKHISDILSQRLMSSFQSELVTFLYEIAELRHFSAELARIATGSAKAAYWIQFLVDRNIMIIPVDPKRRWFRFHTLFRQFLISEAKRHYSAARRSEVHVAAARWLMRRGDQKSAFDLAMNAGELDLITEILEKAACALVREQGDTATFISWIQRAEEIGARRGDLATFWYVWALLFERRFAQANDEIRAAYAQLAKSRDDESSATLRAKLSIAEIAAGVHLDTPETVANVARVWLREHPDGEGFDVAVASAGGLACSRFSSHDFNSARNALRIAQAAISQSNSVYGRSWVETLEAIRETYQGDPAIAVRQLLEIENRARADIAPTAGIVSVVAVVRARALYECGRIEEAEGIVAEHLRRAADNGVPDTTWAGLEVALDSAIRGKGAFTLDALRSIVKEYPKRIGILFELKLIRELALAERTEEAFERARGLGWSAKSGWSPDFLANASEMEKSAARVAAGILLMIAAHLPHAIELFQEEIHFARTAGRRREQVDLNLLCADAYFRSDARTSALRAFTRAIVLTSRQEIYLPFLKHRKLIVYLQENVRPKELGLTNMDEFATLTGVFRMLGLPLSPPTRENASEGAVAPPTPRETELLSLLEAGLDNSQIAERLSVSVRTIKWHLSNLYFKLDVKNRSAAVAKGRALRLLQ